MPALRQTAPATLWMLLLLVLGALAAPDDARGDATVDLVWSGSGTDTLSASEGEVVTLYVLVTAGPSGVSAFSVDVDYSAAASSVEILGFTNAPSGLFPFLFTVGSTLDDGSSISNFNAFAFTNSASGLTPGIEFVAGAIDFIVLPGAAPGTHQLVSSTDPIVGGFIGLLGESITGTVTFNSAYLEIALANDIDVMPTSVDFGDTVVGGSGLQIVTITNVGTDDLTIDSVAFGAGTDAAFSLESAPAPGTMLAPSASADVEIAFSPTDGSASVGTLEIASDDADEPLVQVSLSGQGVAIDDELMEILEFFDEADLQSTAGNRDRAMRQLLESAGDFIDRGDIDQACQTLAGALLRVDGIEPPDAPPVPDFVEGEDAAALAAEIEALREVLGCDPPPGPRCGLGVELVLLLPALCALGRRRR